jgi:hypothetical protein
MIVLYAFLLMTVSAEAGAQLTAAQINALAPGSYVGTWKNKRQLRLTLSSNGTISGSVDGFRYKGRWHVAGQSLCITFQLMALSKTKCGTIRRQGASLVGYYNKKGEPRIRLKPAASNIAAN